MEYKGNKLYKKYSFTRFYSNEIEKATPFIVISITLLLMFISSKLFNDKMLILYVVTSVIIASTVIDLLIYLVKALSTKKRVRYLPLTKDECIRLDIYNLYQVLIFLNDFLRISNRTPMIVILLHERNYNYHVITKHQVMEIGKLFGIDNLQLVHDFPESITSTDECEDVYYCTYEYLKWIEDNKEILEEITLVEETCE